MAYVILPSRRRRPDVFELDHSHPLAQGLVFAGLGQRPGSTRYTDSSIVGNHGASGSARWYINTGRQWLNQNGTSDRIALTGAYPQFTEWTFSIWTDWTVRVGEYNTLLGGGQTGAVYAETPGSNNLRLRILAGSDHAYIYAMCGSTNTEWSYVWNQGAIRGVRNLTFVKTPTTIEFFVDSKSAGSKANAGQFSWNRLVSIGGNTDGTYLYGGNLADPIIHNRALSPAEIAILADRTDPMLEGLIRDKKPAPKHWHLGALPSDCKAKTVTPVVIKHDWAGKPVNEFAINTSFNATEILAIQERSGRKVCGSVTGRRYDLVGNIKLENGALVNRSLEGTDEINIADALGSSFTFLAVVARFADVDVITGPLKVAEVLTGSKFEFNLGNGFGSLSDIHKPRATGLFGDTAVVNMWVNGVKQTSTNPAPVVCETGRYYSILVTVFSNTSMGGSWRLMGTSESVYGLQGGMKIAAWWNKIIPDELAASLSRNPYQLFRPAKRTIYAYNAKHNIVGTQDANTLKWNWGE